MGHCSWLRGSSGDNKLLQIPVARCGSGSEPEAVDRGWCETCGCPTRLSSGGGRPKCGYARQLSETAERRRSAKCAGAAGRIELAAVQQWAVAGAAGRTELAAVRTGRGSCCTAVTVGAAER